MSFLVHDLRCADGHEERDATYRRSEGPSPCPVCDGARSIFYAMASAPLDHTVGGGWRDFTYDGEVIRSPEQFQQKKLEYSRRTGTPMSDIVDVSNGSRMERKVRADEVRHEAYKRRKMFGHDDQSFSRYQAEQRREPQVRIGWKG